MPAPESITVDAGSPCAFCKDADGGAVRNVESAAIAPVVVLAFLGMIFGGGRGPGPGVSGEHLRYEDFRRETTGNVPRVSVIEERTRIGDSHKRPLH